MQTCFPVLTQSVARFAEPVWRAQNRKTVEKVNHQIILHLGLHTPTSNKGLELTYGILMFVSI